MSCPSECDTSCPVRYVITALCSRSSSVTRSPPGCLRAALLGLAWPGLARERFDEIIQERAPPWKKGEWVTPVPTKWQLPGREQRELSKGCTKDGREGLFARWNQILRQALAQHKSTPPPPLKTFRLLCAGTIFVLVHVTLEAGKRIESFSPRCLFARRPPTTSLHT